MNTKQFFMTALVLGVTAGYGIAQETGAINVDSAATANESANADMNGTSMTAENTMSSETQKFMEEAAM